MAAGAWAEVKSANVSGTYKSVATSPKGRTVETAFELKHEGNKVTGTVTGPDGKKSIIEDGKVKDGAVTFQVTREGRNGQKITVKYEGKLSGDNIMGKAHIGQGDKARTIDWEAKLQNADSKPAKLQNAGSKSAKEDRPKENGK
jgi:hypothetical protein